MHPYIVPLPHTVSTALLPRPPAREGINIFLAGFVPTENLRFREESLSFKMTDQGLLDEDVKRYARFTYPDMTKKLGSFTLHVSMPLHYWRQASPALL